MFDKRKKIIFLIALALVFIVSGLFLLIKNNQKTTNNNSAISTEFSPEFLTNKEKEGFMIDPSIKAQVMSRDADGKIKVYRIINSDSDIINPKEVSPIR